jgi:hypothetical protein
MMKQYTKLPIPKGTAWDYKRFDHKLLRIVHWRIKNFFQGIWNIIRWMPTIYNDKDWDDYYITKLLQKKIEHQRAYLVGANRHTNVDRDNFWMTIVLNLIERKHEDYYDMERYNYIVLDDEDILGDPLSENLDEYITKYPGAKRAALKKYSSFKHLHDKETLSLYMAHIRQEKCENLIYEILKRRSSDWWD